MSEIMLIPLEKMLFDGKEVCLGDTKQHILEILGEPETITVYEGESSRHYYYDSELALDYDIDGRLEFIEFLGGHEGALKPYVYGVSVFDTKRNDLTAILTAHNQGKIDDSEFDSYGFLEISVGIWLNDEDDSL